MRFSSAVDSLTKENQFLRTTTKLLILALLGLSMTVLFLHDQEPTVIERSSRGLEIVRVTPLLRTEDDLKAALNLMIRARFDSMAISPEIFLSKRQMELRTSEQQEMNSRNLSQSVVVRNISLKKDEATVDFDRVLAVGEIRSALKTSVKVMFEEIEPTELNPYGLRLSLTIPFEKQEASR